MSTESEFVQEAAAIADWARRVCACVPSTGRLCASEAMPMLKHRSLRHPSHENQGSLCSERVSNPSGELQGKDISARNCAPRSRACSAAE
jgi:hypothetical protein